MADIIDLEGFRRRRADADAPVRRIPRPYRYDPGPLAGKACDRPPPQPPSGEDDPPKATPK